VSSITSALTHQSPPQIPSPPPFPEATSGGDAGGDTGGSDAGGGDAGGPAVDQPKWIACNDEEGNTYYYNSETAECQWDKPTDFDDNGKAEDTGDSKTAALIKAAFEGKLKKLGFGCSENVSKVNEAKKAQKEADAKRVAAGGGHWVEVYDPASDAFYYVSLPPPPPPTATSHISHVYVGYEHCVTLPLLHFLLTSMITTRENNRGKSRNTTSWLQTTS
jgi:hypothetical protein